MPVSDQSLMQELLQTEAGAIAEVVRKHIDVRPVSIERGSQGKATVLAVPTGMAVQSIKPLLDEYLAYPERRKGTAKLDDLDSFILHVNRFKCQSSAVFAIADPESPALCAVLDYHEEEPEGEARWGQHRSRYEFPLSDEWKAWKQYNDVKMSQGDFAAFLEDRIADVGDPSKAGQSIKDFAQQLQCELATPAKLMELSRGMSVNVNGKVAQAQNLSTGEAVVQFQEAHVDGQGQKLKVPGAFMLTIQVFRNGAMYMVPARLRYRVSAGGIVWFYSLYRIDRILDDAIREAAQKAQKATDLPLFFGRPESS